MIGRSAAVVHSAAGARLASATEARSPAPSSNPSIGVHVPAHAHRPAPAGRCASLSGPLARFGGRAHAERSRSAAAAEPTMPSNVRTPILTLPVAAVCAVAALVLSSCGSGVAVTLPTKVKLASTAAAAANEITVSPLPGTSDAGPDTQISFLGARGTTVSSVSVVGSRSGRHAGRLLPYSTGTGESFLPNGSFDAGEHVSVSAKASVGGSSQIVRTSFTIAYQAPIAQAQFPKNPGDRAAVQHYRSAPSITPSTVRISTPARPGAAPGYLFLAPYQGDGAAGPMITDQAGNLVWFHPLPANETATNFRVQQYEGRPVLTWWQGRVLKLGFGQGEDVIYDASYQRDRSSPCRQRLRG